MADSDQLLFASPAQITPRASAGELTQLAVQRAALDPVVFEQHPPFFWTAEISNTRVDAYYTRMAPSTLQNFAQDAATGVSFQNSHATNKLGFGKSLTGQFVGYGGNGVARCVADFYTIPGLRLHEVSTDDFILGVRSGIVSDVSVGFFGGQFRCNICGRDMLRDFDCTHIPGFEYQVKTMPNRADSPTETVLAIAWIENAHLAEVSAVYDGACPGAAILKAQSESENGRIKPQQARMIEARYRIRLPEARHMVAVPGELLSTLQAPAQLELATDGTTPVSVPPPLGPAEEEARSMADLIQDPPAPLNEAAPVVVVEPAPTEAAREAAPTPQENDMSKPEPRAAEAETPEVQERAKTGAYACPKCGQEATKPGICPKCSVPMEKRDAPAEAETEAEAVVETAPDAEGERAKKAKKPAKGDDGEPMTDDEEMDDPDADGDAAGDDDEDGDGKKPWDKKKAKRDAAEGAEGAELRGMLIGAGVANPNDVLGSVRSLITARQALAAAEETALRATERTSALEARANDAEATIRLVRELTEEVQAPEGASLVERVQVALSGLRSAQAEAARLAPLADDGRAYRADLIREALEEGVRAYGPDFAEDTYRTVLENASLETVKRMRQDWRTLADRQFQPGRATTDAPAPTPTPAAPSAAASSEIPDAAFKG